MAITHTFQSSVADGVNDQMVQPSDWNADHTISGGLVSDKVMLTPEGGIAIKLTNKTGANSVKGTLVEAYDTTAIDNAFKLTSANDYDPIGVVYENDVPDGSECWIVVSGRAQVLLKDSTASTRGHVVIVSDTIGRATTIAVPSPISGDNHWRECGHCIESKSAGTSVLAYAVLHFN